MKVKLLVGAIISAIISGLITSISFASTTIEKDGWCRYTNEVGHVRFAGSCKINWGVGSAAACSESTNLAVRYGLFFSKKSEAWIHIYCDERVTVNGKSGKLITDQHEGLQTYHIQTEEGELFEFSKMNEDGPIAISNESSQDFSALNCARNAVRNQKDAQICVGQIARNCTNQVYEEMIAAGGNPGNRVQHDCQVAETSEWSSAWIWALSDNTWGGESFGNAFERFAKILDSCSKALSLEGTEAYQEINKCLAKELVTYLAD